MPAEFKIISNPARLLWPSLTIGDRPTTFLHPAAGTQLRFQHFKQLIPELSIITNQQITQETFTFSVNK